MNKDWFEKLERQKTCENQIVVFEALYVDFLVKLPPRPLNNTVLNESFDKNFGGKIQIPSHVL